MELFHFKKTDNTYKLYGTINEYSNFSGIFDHSIEHSLLDFSSIRRIYPSGIRTWINSINKYKGTIIYINCSSIVTEWLNIIPNLITKNVSVSSFNIQENCKHCRQENEIYLSLRKNYDLKKNTITELLSCDNCSKLLKINPNENKYFRFTKQLRDNYLKKKLISINPRKSFSSEANINTLNDNINSVSTVHKGFVENISIGGLFIRNYFDTKIGSKINVEFNIPCNESMKTISSEAEVRWIRKPDYNKNILKGIGIQFLKLNTEYKIIIDNFINNFETSAA